MVKTIRVKNPITQEFAGTHGTYTQANIEKQRSYNLPQWKSLTEESNHQPPARRGERRRAPAPPPKPKPKPARTASPLPETGSLPFKRGRGRPRKHPLRVEVESPQPEPSIESQPDASEREPQLLNPSAAVPPTPTSPATKTEDQEAEIKEEDDSTEVTQDTPSTPTPEVKRGRGRPRKSDGPKAKAAPRVRVKAEPRDTLTSVTSRRMHNKREQFDIDESAFKGFDYHLGDADQFTPDRCRELEEVYWRTINYGTPMYGADMPGSLFKDDTPCWNVAKLPNLLDVLGTNVPGVNTAYLYLGMWKATFAWHLEDVDLYSINYIHFGAPKQWYSVSQEDARRFEAAMQTIWPNDAKHCDQFLRHKTYLISPEKLKTQFGIKVNKLVHYEGEFVITYPYGYHSGFNLGYNCAESVNFATQSWLDCGRIAKKCNCESDSVWVDVYEIERKLRGEPTPEFMEITDDEMDYAGDYLPSPAASHTGKRGRPPAKRKRDDKTRDPGREKKKIKVRVKAATHQPCILERSRVRPATADGQRQIGPSAVCHLHSRDVPGRGRHWQRQGLQRRRDRQGAARAAVHLLSRETWLGVSMLVEEVCASIPRDVRGAGRRPDRHGPGADVGRGRHRVRLRRIRLSLSLPPAEAVQGRRQRFSREERAGGGVLQGARAGRGGPGTLSRWGYLCWRGDRKSA
jgi:hypothetical protein